MSDPVPVTPPKPVETYESLAGLFDLHMLEPTLTTEAVAAKCKQAAAYGLRAVVVRPCDVDLVVHWARGPLVGATAGYPDGVSTTAAKLYEARDLLRIGAKEIQFVLNPSRLLSRQFQHVEIELMQIAKSCQESGARLTVVYNSRWLADDLKIIATKICRRAEANAIAIDGVPDEVALFRPLLKDVLTLKLATPVNSLDEALQARDGGYARIATTDPFAMLEEWKQRLAAQTQPPPIQS